MTINHPQPAPLNKPYFTPGTLIVLAFMVIGFLFGISRLLTGLGAVTNLSNSYPWGIWIAMDVACGVALAAGGFTTAAIVDIFGRKRFHSLLRPAILTAWLGYIMVAIGLLFDLGRYWNIWQPLFHWQGNSVMFELAMCVMAYLVVLTLEMAPATLEGINRWLEQRFGRDKNIDKFTRIVTAIHTRVRRMLPLFIVAGVVLSCMHQSSLGTLMVIAPMKLSPLWHTALLPLLFLLSAIMVGPPMVVLESIISSTAFKRDSEMDILAPFARLIPWFIGVYAFVKFLDLGIRSGQLDFGAHPGATMALAVEIVLGLFVPFVLLLWDQTRRSKGWLMLSCILLIFGVVLNRINVFLVGYRPRFAEGFYFPSLTEIGLTIGLVAALILLYRFFVINFPILPAQKGEIVPLLTRKRLFANRPPLMALNIPASAVIFLLSFVFLYSTVHHQAIQKKGRVHEPIQVRETTPEEHLSPIGAAHLNRPEKYRNFYTLESQILNQQTDYYESVPFSHRSHDVAVGSDCAACHHRVSDSPSDKIGQDLKSMHDEIEVRIGGSCTTCHEDMTEKEIQKCGDCHLNSNEEDFPARIGLKGAYHRQCIGCHLEQPDAAEAPTACDSCHHPHVPSHETMIIDDASPTPMDITRQCLRCHEVTGKDILKTAHWNLKGLTPCILGHEHEVDTGLDKIVDNYTITMLPSLVESRSYHIGYTPEGHTFDPRKAENIDCLVCHDTTTVYAKDESCSGLPDEKTDLIQVARQVGRPSRQNCGHCHFNMGGGPNVKHGDLEPALAEPDNTIDIHMGPLEMRCQSCHKTSRHQIAGMSFVAPVMEGRVHCETCHGNHPHGITGYLSRHLDDHVKAVSCEACHIPFFANNQATLLRTDFSTTGNGDSGPPLKSSDQTFDRKWGTRTWGQRIIPEYRWFDGTRRTHILGEEIDPDESIELNAPMGEKHLPNARIYPFKVHTARQPYDSESNILVAVKFKDGFWEHSDWNRAIQAGMDEVGMDYSGKYDFVETRMYNSIHHGVVSAPKALGCSDCHRVEAVSCRRCHRSATGMDQPSHTRKVYPDSGPRLNFKALGYEDDPAFIGGRFTIGLGRGKPNN